MALQIANGRVIEKIDELAELTGLSKTAAVEVAVENLLAEARRAAGFKSNAARIDAILAQIDRIPDRPDAFDPLEWDDVGLPK